MHLTFLRGSLLVAFTVTALQLETGRATADDTSALRQLKGAYGAAPDEYELALEEGAHRADDEPEIVRERYPDGKVKIERQVTVDADGNYVNHGAWKMLNQAGDVVAEGQFNTGRRIGLWSQWHGRQAAPLLGQFPFNNFKPPFHAQATFVNNQMEGEWLIVDSAKRKCMQISLADGKRHGTLTTWLPNGSIHRQATYERGIPVGDVLELDSQSGQLKKVATYLDGRKLITKTAHHERNKEKKSEEQFLAATTVEQSPDDFWTLKLAEYAAEGDDIRHGPSKSWYENGKIQVDGSYHYGKRTGMFTYYYDNGQIASTGEYDNDVPEDVWVWWHTNGQKATVGEYTQGALIGEWRWWKEDGKLADRKTYDGSQQARSGGQETVETSQARSLTPVR